LTLLTSAIDAVGAGVAVVDGRDGWLRVAYANDSFRARTQCVAAAAEEFQLAAAAGPGRALEDMVLACAASSPQHRRVAFHLGDVLVAIDVTVSRHVLDGGGPWYVLIVRDAAEAIAIAARDDRGAHLARAAVGSGAGHWDWDLVAGCVWYERRFKELLGRGPDELANTFVAFQDLVHDDDRPRLLQALRQHIEQHRLFDLAVRVRHREGDFRWLRLCGAATRDPAGRPMHISGRLEDISEQRRALDGLQRSEESLRRTLDGLPFAIGVLHCAGEIVEINRAWREFDDDRARVRAALDREMTHEH
jgi:PAS domain S-box-containing protein